LYSYCLLFKSNTKIKTFLISASKVKKTFIKIMQKRQKLRKKKNHKKKSQILIFYFYLCSQSNSLIIINFSKFKKL